MDDSFLNLQKIFNLIDEISCLSFGKDFLTISL